MLIDFSGKRVLVVAGAGGFNQGMAELFARQLVRVAVASCSQKEADSTLERLRKLGGDASGFVTGVRDLSARKNGVRGRLAPDGELRRRVAESVPLGRLGTPDDIGNACLFSPQRWPGI